jgi:hypothetical protein
MKRFKKIYCGLIASSALSTGAVAFEDKPWLGNQYEFTLDSRYSYSWFNRLAGGEGKYPHPFHSNLFSVDLGLSPLDGWGTEVEVEFAQTSRQQFGKRSIGAMVRGRLLNDLTGDFISLTTGLNARVTSRKSLRDISCPSSSRFDLEVHAAFGKEWSCRENWLVRLYGITALGQGSRGLPWIKTKAALDIRQNAISSWELYSVSYCGFGTQRRVDPDHFRGWGPYRHSSVDVGASYSYHLPVWGRFSLDIVHRCHAYVYPARMTGFSISYHLPFSLL